MNKTELIKEIANETGLPATSVDKFLKAFVSVVSEALTAGDILRLVNFMTFSTTKRAARKGTNPQTGKKITIPAATIPKVKFGKALKNMVNGV